jgi:hypothetical protein
MSLGLELDGAWQVSALCVRGELEQSSLEHVVRKVHSIAYFLCTLYILSLFFSLFYSQRGVQLVLPLEVGF